MKLVAKSIMIVGTALALGACSGGTSLLDAKSGVPSASAVPVGNNLAMPPDLQLRAPTQTTDAYQPNQGAAPLDAAIDGTPLPPGKAPTKLALAKGSTVPVGKKDIFAELGISKVHDDGTPKTVNELRDELKAALLKKHQQTNPNYGTVANIGAIFHDQ